MATQEGSHGGAGRHHPHTCCRLLKRNRGAEGWSQESGGSLSQLHFRPRGPQTSVRPPLVPRAQCSQSGQLAGGSTTPELPQLERLVGEEAPSTGLGSKPRLEASTPLGPQQSQRWSPLPEPQPDTNRQWARSAHGLHSASPCSPSLKILRDKLEGQP